MKERNESRIEGWRAERLLHGRHEILRLYLVFDKALDQRPDAGLGAWSRRLARRLQEERKEALALDSGLLLDRDLEHKQQPKFDSFQHIQSYSTLCMKTLV